MHGVNWTLVSAIVGAIAALGVIGTALDLLWKKVGRTFIIGGLQLIRDLNGMPERRDHSGALIAEAEPGILARVKTTEQLGHANAEGLKLVNVRLDEVVKQLSPNSGKTAYDQAKRGADVAEKVLAAVTKES